MKSSTSPEMDGSDKLKFSSYLFLHLPLKYLYDLQQTPLEGLAVFYWIIPYRGKQHPHEPS